MEECTFLCIRIRTDTTPGVSVPLTIVHSSHFRSVLLITVRKSTKAKSLFSVHVIE